MADMPVAVLDVGSETTKAGFANPEEGPILIAPTAVTRKGDPTGELLRSVVQGQVEDWDRLECTLHHVLYDQLGWEFDNEGSVLATEPLFASRRARENFTRMMFENFNVHGLYTAEQPVLSLYAIGRLTGTVVDIGHTHCGIAPVQEGATLLTAARRIQYGGDALTAHLRSLMHKAGDAVDDAAAAALKHACCGVVSSSREFQLLESQNATSKPAKVETHTLPDGKTFTVKHSEGLRTGEALLKPALMGFDRAGIIEETHTSIMSCVPDLRRALFESIMICGGGSSIKGLGSRFVSEMIDLAPPSTRPAILHPPEYLPETALKHSSWIGGAVLAKIVFPQNQYITKLEYDESGPGIIHRKCPT